jgi:acyl dehydratase
MAAAPTVLDGADGVTAALGTHLGHSDWLVVDQARIDRFAAATGDDQWIHVDAERARAESPFGGPVAQGTLILALTNLFLPQIVEVRGFAMGVNYGVDEVRLPAPVPAGSSVRGGAELIAVDPVKGGIQTTMTVTVEVDGRSEPACIARALSRYLF